MDTCTLIYYSGLEFYLFDTAVVVGLQHMMFYDFIGATSDRLHLWLVASCVDLYGLAMVTQLGRHVFRYIGDFKIRPAKGEFTALISKSPTYPAKMTDPETNTQFQDDKQRSLFQIHIPRLNPRVSHLRIYAYTPRRARSAKPHHWG